MLGQTIMNDRFRTLTFVTGLTLLLNGPAANADLLGISRATVDPAPPVAEFISRNAELRKLSGINPELAQLIAKRLMELAEQGGTAQALEGATGDSANPDIDRLIRSSPEAVLDLVELMRQAAKAR